MFRNVLMLSGVEGSFFSFFFEDLFPTTSFYAFFSHIITFEKSRLLGLSNRSSREENKKNQPKKKTNEILKSKFRKNRQPKKERSITKETSLINTLLKRNIILTEN